MAESVFENGADCWNNSEEVKHDIWFKRVFDYFVIPDGDGCWDWDGVKKRGYAMYGQARMHRVIFELFYGPIPLGMLVCHRCDNPSCCNPFHLFLGEPRDNVMDAVKKGRWKGQKGEYAGEGMKKCPACQEIKPRTEFYNPPWKCKPCILKAEAIKRQIERRDTPPVPELFTNEPDRIPAGWRTK